ncbi:MAG: hypothetical protein H6734_04580 [Alphaproteobacteria bacterium]|nr:hypothetical protein [Alphaproteobacteria bacterium]
MWMLLSLALADPSVVGTHVTEGRLADRIVNAPADVVLLYGGEQRGSQGDCGCPHDPRGSLGRTEAYAEAVRATGVPVLLLNPGNWLNDPVGEGNTLRPDAWVQDDLMVRAIEAGSWDALNVSFRDLPFLGDPEHGPRQLPDGVVSANARGLEGLPDHVVLPAGDLKVAVTGVTLWSKPYLQPAGVEQLDPVDALSALLPSLNAEADVVVVLAYGLGKRAKELASLDIDVLIEADGLRTRYDPVVWEGTVWVRGYEQTQVLGELRLTVSEGEVVRAFDRGVDLDGDIPWPRAWRKRYKRDLAAVREAQERTLAP